MGAKTRKLSQINDSLIEWQSVVVADGSTGLTAVAGRGYFINTTAGAITVTFPASPKIGDTIIINDYASTFATNNVTINFNGNKLEADTTNATLQTNDQTHTFVFTDATQGWKIVNQDTGSSIQPVFISATGGTVLTDGNFKTHVFTGDGCFVVSQVGNSPVSPTGGPGNVDYLVVAGGGGGGSSGGGGGGAGGYRTSFPSPGCNAGSFPITATTYPITVGSGGGAAAQGNNSIFSTITSAGGGLGDSMSARCAGVPGGSGGGGARTSTPTCSGNAGGSGNSPPVNPPQGNNGGNGTGGPGGNSAGGGGGGAGGTGSNSSPANGGSGGAGSPIATTLFGPTAPSYGTPGPAPGRYFAGGGGGGSFSSGGSGGAGGGGAGTIYNGTAGTGTANSGGGGGGGGTACGVGSSGSAGGKGIVIIRYKFQ